MAAEGGAEAGKDESVQSPIAGDSPREDEEYRESEEDRVNADRAGEHEVQIHKSAEECGDADDCADYKPDAD